MSDELKTLEDLKNDDWKESDGFSWLDYDEVRELAIKWVRAFDDLENNPGLKKFCGNEEECWVKHFFNITEEELK